MFSTSADDERAGPSSKTEMAPEASKSETRENRSQPAPSSPKAKTNIATPAKQVPPPKVKPPIKANTLAKRAANAETPSPVRSPETARVYYQNNAAEARAVHKKGVENLEKFKNLKASVKVEIRKALDRLYELTIDASVVRNLEKELTEDTPPKRIDGKEETEKLRETCTLGKILEKHTILMKESMEKMESLKESMEKTEDLKKLMIEQTETIAKATYASVVTTGPTIRATKERTALHSVIVSSNNDQDTGEEVLEKVRKAIDATEGWINVEKVRKAKDRKIIVGCSTEEERRKIKQRLEKKGDHLLVEEVKNRDPLLVLKNVISKHSDEDIIKAVKNQNREIFRDLDKDEDRLTIKFRKKCRNPHTNHVVLMASPTIWRRAVDAGRLRVDLQRVYVEDQSPLVQCSRCLGYGHGRRFCKESEDLCSHCGGLHFSTECPDKVVGEAPQCINCRRAKLENSRHNAFSRECPLRKKWDKIARTSVSYC